MTYRRALEMRVEARRARRPEWRALHQARRLEAALGAPVPDRWFARVASDAACRDFARAAAGRLLTLEQAFAAMRRAFHDALPAFRRAYAPISELQLNVRHDFAVDPALAALGALPRWEDDFAAMTRADAELVRRLRVDEELTWRGVAAACAATWGGDWGSNQIAGMDLCERAAPFFGELFGEDPWN